MSEKYVTNLSYLKVTVKPKLPKIIQSLNKIIMRHGFVPLVKILGLVLGVGYAKNGIKRYPECSSFKGRNS